jgi:hypothetical protein
VRQSAVAAVEGHSITYEMGLLLAKGERTAEVVLRFLVRHAAEVLQQDSTEAEVRLTVA